jgi:aminodeoxyfutalosine deaminase
MQAECESTSEQDLDVRLLLNPGEEPRRDVRLKLCDGVLTDLSSVPAGKQPQPLALVPQLVNAHTHLEFSALNRPLDAGASFPDWIRSVIRLRQSNDFDARAATDAGLHESVAAGVTTLGEISTNDDLLSLPEDSEMQVVSFREFIGLAADGVDEAANMAQRHISRFQNCPEPVRQHAGISPHAPYSVHPDLFETLIEISRDRRVTVAMHLAETREEMELLSNGTGPFRDFLQSLDLWDPAVFRGGRDVRPFLESLSTVRRALVVHGNYLTATELGFLSSHQNLALVYCPRTHAHFRHSSHPWQRVLQAGGRVVLGTDGRASNPDLSIWRELQYAARQAPDFTAPQLLRMITTDAADALGLDPRDYRIAIGHRLRGTFLQYGASRSTSAEELLRDARVQPAGSPDRVIGQLTFPDNR